MTIRRNDPPGHAVVTVGQQTKGSDEHVRIAGIERDSQVHHASIGSRYSDLTQLGDNRFAENETNIVGRCGEACISSGRGAQQPGVQNRGDRGRRDDRKPETNEKKGRLH